MGDVLNMAPRSSFWDKRYSQPGFAYGTNPNEFLVRAAPRIPEGPVLCLASGEGRNAVHLAELGHEVTAVDLSQAGLEKTKLLAAERGVSLWTTRADLADFEIEPGAWSGIVAIFAHLPPQVRRRLHRDVVQGLAPGGAFVLEAYTADQLEHGTGGPPVRELLFGLDELREELDGLELVHAKEIVRHIEEGKFHHGTSAVVQVFGVRPSAA